MHCGEEAETGTFTVSTTCLCKQYFAVPAIYLLEPTNGRTVNLLLLHATSTAGWLTSRCTLLLDLNFTLLEMQRKSVSSCQILSDDTHPSIKTTYHSLLLHAARRARGLTGGSALLLKTTYVRAETQSDADMSCQMMQYYDNAHHWLCLNARSGASWLTCLHTLLSLSLLQIDFFY